MDKFNKKTLIIGLLIVIGLAALAISTFGQIPTYTKDLNPPTNLTAEVINDNDVSLYWNAPSSGGSTYLHWDNGENYTSYGNFIMPWVVDYAAKWDPDHIAERFDDHGYNRLAERQYNCTRRGEWNRTDNPKTPYRVGQERRR